MKSKNRALRRLVEAALVLPFLCGVLTAAGEGPAQASAQVDCQSALWHREGAGYITHGVSNTGSYPVHVDGPYADCYSTFTLYNGQIVIEDCKRKNTLQNWWVHITVQGDGRKGWVYYPYLYNWDGAGLC